MEKRMQRMEEMVGNLGGGPLPGVLDQNESHIPSRDQAYEDFDTQNQISTSFNQPQQPWKLVMDPAHGPGAIPASCVFEPSRASTDRQRSAVHPRSDIVSRGIISLATAEKHINLYRQRLDPIVYHILAEHDSLASIRSQSSLLVAAICAVSALNSASPDYKICYEAFRQEFAAQLLSKEHTFDDVRALCIGAFFLSDLSWNLVGAGGLARLSYLALLFAMLTSLGCSCAYRYGDQPPPMYNQNSSYQERVLLKDPAIFHSLRL